MREVVEARAYPELLKDVDQTWDVLPSQMPKVEVVGLCSPGFVLAGTDPIYRHLTGPVKIFGAHNFPLTDGTLVP